jgi:hypothetical protein
MRPCLKSGKLFATSAGVVYHVCGAHVDTEGRVALEKIPIALPVGSKATLHAMHLMSPVPDVHAA